MKENFDLNEFKSLLNDLRCHLDEAIEEDEEYQGEIDEIMEVIDRLQREFMNIKNEKEFYEKKYEKLLPDIMKVIGFMDMMMSIIEDEEDEIDVEALDYFDGSDDDDEEDEDEDDEVDWEALDYLDEMEDSDEEEEDDEEDEHDEFLKQEFQQKINAFIRSTFFKDLSEIQKNNVVFILECFFEYISPYASADPTLWTKEDIKEICLETFPRKVSAESAFFHHVGPVLIAFFKFLAQTKQLKQANKLVKCLEAIQHKIPQVAEDPTNWGIAKTFAMQAISENVDLEDPIQRENFIKQFNSLINNK